MMKGIRCLGGLMMAGALGACSLLPDASPVSLYRLPPSSLVSSSAPPVDWSLRIVRPSVPEPLAGSRILVLPEPTRISAYQGARWSAPVPILWREWLLDAFSADGRVGRLSGDNDVLAADLELGGSLRAFQSEYRDGRPVVVIRLDARLVDRHRHIIASQRFEALEIPQGPQVPAVVAAFGRAGDRVARAVVDWTLSHSPPQ